MCRMLAVHAAEPISSTDILLAGPHALVEQSRLDRAGDHHRDGWGIGWYDDAGPHVSRSIAPAGDDPRFVETAKRAVGQIVLAHVRDASVGVIREENCHPFVYGPWMFCHNGTLEGFDRLQPSFERETLPELQAARHGDTDSEALFLWLLSNTVREGFTILPGDGDPATRDRIDVDGLYGIVRESLRRLAGWAAAAQLDPPKGLNLLLTDGRILIAVRHGRTLSWRTLQPIGGARPTVIIASEPTDAALHDALHGWREFEDRSILTIDAAGRVALRSS